MAISQIVKAVALKFPALKHHLNFTTTTSDGNWKIPIIAGMGAGNINEREDQVGYIINNVLKNHDGAFLDVGSNIGQTLLHFLSSKSNSIYVGFDVQVWCAAYVQNLIQVNCCENAFVYPYGLSNKNSIVKIFSRGSADVGASIDPKFRDRSFYRKETHGVTRIGDEVVKEIDLDKIALIKIDVEGSEADVISGLTKTIEKQRPYIISEILPTGHEKNSEISMHRKQNMERIEKFFDDLYYHIYRINPDRTITRVESLDMENFDLSLCNYLFSPKALGEGAPW
jgi:FkbM family methyltransferase